MHDPGFAPAKVNLALHVTGQRRDGLHLLDSLVGFADVGDRLVAAADTELTLRVSGPMAEGVPVDGRNLVLRAAEWMGCTARFELDKCLPAAAGLGGGSSDAAAALRLLSGISGKDIPDGAEALGADVPVCLMARAARMRGIGEILEPVLLPPLAALLVNPGVEMPTGKVFAGLAEKQNPALPETMPEFADAGAAIEWIARQRNDLEAPAIATEPAIGDLLDRLKAMKGARLARMSGSGATCFALFDTAGAARAGAAAIQAQSPAFWCAAVMLR